MQHVYEVQQGVFDVLVAVDLRLVDLVEDVHGILELFEFAHHLSHPLPGHESEHERDQHHRPDAECPEDFPHGHFFIGET